VSDDVAKPTARSIPAVVMAGDRAAAKAIEEKSKVFLELAGKSLVAHVVEVLQQVPQVSEVWVVGNRDHLAEALAPLEPSLAKPLTILPQFRNLYENAWETYRRSLPGAGPGGRDPSEQEAKEPYLYVSADLPFATPQEVSAFIDQALAENCHYALGLADRESLRPFARGEPSYRVAYFNLADGRYRQTNLHLVKPALIRHRYLIGEMYEHRYQREIGNIIPLAWQMLHSEGGGLSVLWYYGLIHLAGWLDRRKLTPLADWVRKYLPLKRIAGCVSSVLATDFRFVVTDVGGCAVDIDDADQYEAAVARYEEWRSQQDARAASMYGPPQEVLPARVSLRLISDDEV